jgi:hypothetical protein
MHKWVIMVVWFLCATSVALTFRNWIFSRIPKKPCKLIIRITCDSSKFNAALEDAERKIHALRLESETRES